MRWKDKRSTSEVNLYSYQPGHFISCTSPSARASALLWLQRGKWTWWLLLYICRAEKLLLWLPANVLTQLKCPSATIYEPPGHTTATARSPELAGGAHHSPFWTVPQKHRGQLQEANKTSSRGTYAHRHPQHSVSAFICYLHLRMSVGKFK